MVQTVKMALASQDLCPGVKMLFAYQEKVNKQKKCDQLKQDIQGLKVVLDEMKQRLASMRYDQEHPPIGQGVVEFHAQAIYENEQDIDFYETVINDIAEEYRKLVIQPVTEQMDEVYAKQKEHYQIQKDRFETCKQKYGRNHTMFFPESDQEFISNHRAKNEAYMNQWQELYLQREMLNQEIDQETGVY